MPSKSIPSSPLSDSHHLSARKLILQHLRKPFHSDISAKNSISCSPCEQEAPLALLSPVLQSPDSPVLSPVSSSLQLDDYKVRKNSVCTERPAHPRAWGGTLLTHQRRACLAWMWAVAVGAGMDAQANPGSPALFAFRTQSSRHKSHICTARLHSNRKVKGQDIP